MTKTICIYHGNCADGFTAAWAVRHAAVAQNVDFVPAVYGEAPPDVTGADVVLVDFSYKRPVLFEMAAAARSVLVLDHHKTAAEDLAGIPKPRGEWHDHIHEATYHDDRDGPYLRAVFDMDRSGAQLAWDYFHRDTGYHAGMPLNRPPLVDYVADRDLWRFDLPYSRDTAAWLFSHAYDFDTWDRLEATLRHEDSFKRAVAEGQAITRKHDKDISELLAVLQTEMVIGGHRVPVANLPYTMASDAAGRMAGEAPFAACYFDRPDARVFSLRSRGEGGLDVSEIAAAYGGGGHRNAAGFQVPLGWSGDE